jgi:hypothetical protein
LLQWKVALDKIAERLQLETFFGLELGKNHQAGEYLFQYSLQQFIV